MSDADLLPAAVLVGVHLTEVDPDGTAWVTYGHQASPSYRRTLDAPVIRLRHSGFTGPVDLNGAYRGSRAIDIGHCRRYLAALYSPEWSDQLRSLQVSIAGATLDPWWDLYALLHHDSIQPQWIHCQVAGRRPLMRQV